MSSPVKEIANLNDDDDAEEIDNDSNYSSDSDNRKRPKTYTPAFKLKAVNFAKSSSIHSASRRFKVDRHSIREWRNSEDQLKML